MPTRIWIHDIHSFLGLLRHRLPQSLEHMLTFNYYAYRMMELRKFQTFIVIYQPLTPPPPVYETVLAFEDAWMECLGRY